MISSSAKSMRALRLDRIKNHKFTRCGNPLDNHNKKQCKACRIYSQKYNLQESNNLSNEEHAFLLFYCKNNKPKGSFGRCLKKHMLLNIMSPMVLARELNVSTKTVDRWLYRGSIPKKEKWSDIASLFNTTIHELGLE